MCVMSKRTGSSAVSISGALELARSQISRRREVQAILVCMALNLTARVASGYGAGCIHACQ